MIGTRVNNYLVTRLIGEGGMGSVFEGENPLIGRRVAIKFLRPELAADHGLVVRFLNEARAANASRHPGIVDVFDAGILDGGVPYLVMERLEGESLSRRLERTGRLPEPVAATIGAEVASALGAAHAKGIIHRDLKPENIFLATDGARARVKILDFGIAKLRGDIGSNQVKTQVGALLGTLPYMSPEQCRGGSESVDHRSDIYSLGIIIFEMVCGRRPFAGNGWGETVVQHLRDDPPAMTAGDVPVSPWIEAIVRRALEKDAGRRFSSMQEVEAALGQGLAAGPAVVVAPAETAIATPSPVTTQVLAPPSASRSAAGGATGTRVLPSSLTPPPSVMVRPLAPTTLSQAATSSASATPRRTPLLRSGRLAGLAAVAGVAILAAFAVRRQAPSPYRAAASPVAAPASPLAPAPPPVPSPPIVERPPATPSDPPALAHVATVVVRVKPSDASIYRLPGRVPLGAGPLTMTVDQGTETRVRLLFERAGYLPRVVDLSAKDAPTLEVRLLRPSAPSPRPVEAPVPATPKL